MTEPLMERLGAWLEGQPEWRTILSQPRAVRRAAAGEVAHGLLSVPVHTEVGLNRKMKRALTRAFNHAGGEARVHAMQKDDSSIQAKIARAYRIMPRRIEEENAADRHLKALARKLTTPLTEEADPALD